MRSMLMTALAVLVILAFGLVAGCGSPEPFDVSGTSVGTSSTPDGAPVTEGSTVTITGTDTAKLTGDLVGTNESKSTMVVDMTTGALSLEYDVTFTGNIGDKSGSITSHGVGTGQMTSETAGGWGAEETVTSGTGDFEGITGTFHSEGQFSSAGGGGTFTGTLQYK
jgi:hypothetical protein